MILGVFEHLPIIVLSTLLYTFPIFRVFLYSDAIDVKKKRMIKEIELERPSERARARARDGAGARQESREKMFSRVANRARVSRIGEARVVRT